MSPIFDIPHIPPLFYSIVLVDLREPEDTCNQDILATVMRIHMRIDGIQVLEVPALNMLDDASWWKLCAKLITAGTPRLLQHISTYPKILGVAASLLAAVEKQFITSTRRY